MTPDHLLTFAAVADAGNISRAALALHLSQPAVSGQLRALQESFGEPLYRRSGHGIALTAAGERLAAHARQLRQAFQQAQIQAHQQGIALMQNYSTGGDVPALRTLAAGAIPVMQRHLATAQSLQLVAPAPPPPPMPAPSPGRAGERG